MVMIVVRENTCFRLASLMLATSLWRAAEIQYEEFTATVAFSAQRAIRKNLHRVIFPDCYRSGFVPKHDDYGLDVPKPCLCGPDPRLPLKGVGGKSKVLIGWPMVVAFWHLPHLIAECCLVLHF